MQHLRVSANSLLYNCMDSIKPWVPVASFSTGTASMYFRLNDRRRFSTTSRSVMIYPFCPKRSIIKAAVGSSRYTGISVPGLGSLVTHRTTRAS